MNLAAFHAFLSQPQVYMPVIGVTMLALFIAKKPATAIYVGLMPLINWSFAHVPNFPIPAPLGGGVFQPLAIVTGLVLVVRDFAQREIGHRILAAMLLGLAFSAMTTPLQIVAASGIAFAVSETVDWAVYTFTKRPLSQRIMLSSLFGAPIDTSVFLFGANMVTPGIFAWGTAITSVLSKLTGAAVVAWMVLQREKAADPAVATP